VTPARRPERGLAAVAAAVEPSVVTISVQTAGWRPRLAGLQATRPVPPPCHPSGQRADYCLRGRRVRQVAVYGQACAGGAVVLVVHRDDGAADRVEERGGD
jgi:hypothetical protein